MPTESALSRTAREDIARLATLIRDNSDRLSPASVGQTFSEENPTILALRLMNAGEYLRQQAQIVMDEETKRIRAEFLERTNAALFAATSAPAAL